MVSPSDLLTILVALVSLLFGLFATMRTELLKSRLDSERAEEAARRDYEYEARKRLYSELEPLLFQLTEASESAARRIKSLARTARDGHLEGADNWLGHKEYYYWSTLYKLLLPAAIVRLLQRRLTLVDLDLDKVLRERYVIAKAIGRSFNEDFALADTGPKLDYEPNYNDWRTHGPKVASRPNVYQRQGIVLGKLENTLEEMFVTDAAGHSRCMTYGEFERHASTKGAAVQGISYLFLGFHPRSRPVLWRILVLQASLYGILQHAMRAKEPFLGRMPPAGLSAEERKSYDWWPGSGMPAGSDTPFEAVARYLSNELKPVQP